MGGNHLGQLGIGKHMNQTTVPFLIRTLDGKNITQISAGHYHNAVVADGRLYTWGYVDIK
jgi:alpha-tubulin suppressor-like RCC1 family protein